VLGPALRAQPDRRLVTLVREGYEAAFEEIVRRYARPLARYAGAIVGARAEDVTQDAFSKALLALRRDDAEIDLRPWLYRIVRNTALNELRDHPPEAEALAEAVAGGQGPAERAEQREQLAEVIERLRALPQPQRAAIVMRELEGLSHEEIATALGLSGGGARQAIYRARQALRDGAALLLPLPFLRFLIEHGGDAATAGAAGGAGGAVVAATGASGAGAGGVALKAGVVAAVLAGSVGTGVALRDEASGPTAGAAAVAKPRAAPPASLTPPPPVLTASATGDAAHGGSGGGGDPAGERGQGQGAGDNRALSDGRTVGDGRAIEDERGGKPRKGPRRGRGHPLRRPRPDRRGQRRPGRHTPPDGGVHRRPRPPHPRQSRPPRDRANGEADSDVAIPNRDRTRPGGGLAASSLPTPPRPQSEEEVAPVEPEGDVERDGDGSRDGTRDLRP
jgi:RNA polymerase sigma factor (sigma-70 family)